VKSPAGDLRLRAIEFDLRSERCLRAIPQCREHLAGLVVVVVDALLAEDHQLRRFLLDELEEDAGRGERLDLRVRLDQDRAVGAHGEAGTQLLLGISRPDADDDDFAGAAFLFDAQRLFERNLVEGVDAHLDAVGHDTRAVRLDADADVVVHDPFQAHQNLAHTRLRTRKNAAGRRRATVRETPPGSQTRKEAVSGWRLVRRETDV